MIKENRKKNEEFDTFLEKEILTANRYDGEGRGENESTRYARMRGLTAGFYVP